MQLSVLITVLLPLVAVFNIGDATAAWSKPVITATDGAGAYSFAEDTVTGPAGLATTFEATPASGQNIDSYTLLPTTTPFSLVGTTGELNLDTALDYETTTTYTFEITAVDDSGTPLSATATITITVTDVNDVAPTFASAGYTMCIADASPADTSLGTVLATDVDTSTTFTHSIEATMGSTDFSIVPATGVITVATGKTIVSATQSQYGLIIKVTDTGDTHSATAVLIVTVDCSSAATVAMGITTLLVALLAALQ